MDITLLLLASARIITLLALFALVVWCARAIWIVLDSERRNDSKEVYDVKFRSAVSTCIVTAMIAVVIAIFSSVIFSHTPKLRASTAPITVQKLEPNVVNAPIVDLTPKKSNPQEDLEKLRRSTDELVK